MEKKFVPAGELLIMKDDSSKDMFYVESGRFLAYTYGNEGRIELGEIHPGELIGESSLLLDSSRSASVEALEDSVVTCINPVEFKSIFDAQHPWMRALIQSLVTRVKYMNKKLEQKP